MFDCVPFAYSRVAFTAPLARVAFTAPLARLAHRTHQLTFTDLRTDAAYTTHPTDTPAIVAALHTWTRARLSRHKWLRGGIEVVGEVSGGRGSLSISAGAL